MDRAEFVAAMIKELSGGLSSPWTPQEVFKKMEFDFPEVNASAAKVLSTALWQSLLKRGDGKKDCRPLPAGVYLTPRFVTGVLYCCGHASKDAPDSCEEYAVLASSLLLGVFERSLGSIDDAAVLLDSFEGFEVDAAGLKAGEEAPVQKPRQTSSGDECNAEQDGAEVWAAEEDPDDFIFEDGRAAAMAAAMRGGMEAGVLSPGAALPVRGSAGIKRNVLGVAEIRSRLLALSTAVGYEVFAAISPHRWNELRLTSCLSRVLSLLLGSGVRSGLLDGHDDAVVGASVDDLRSCWPRFLFLLRDRMTHRPRTIPHVLPALIETAAHLTLPPVATAGTGAGLASETNVRGCCHPIVLGVLGAVASDMGVAAAAQEDVAPLRKLLLSLLPHVQPVLQAIVARTHILADGGDAAAAEELSVLRAELSAVLAVLRFACAGGGAPAAAAADPVDALMCHGVLRTALSAWLDERVEASSLLAHTEGGATSLGRFLLATLRRSPAAAAYAARIPRLLGRMRSEELAQRSAADAVLWPMMLAACAPDAPGAAELGVLAQRNLASAVDAVGSAEGVAEGSCAELWHSSAARTLVDVLTFISERASVRRLASWDGATELRGTLRALEALLRRAAAGAAASLAPPPAPAPIEDASAAISATTPSVASAAEVPDDELADRQLAKTDRRVQLRRLVKRTLARLAREAGD